MGSDSETLYQICMSINYSNSDETSDEIAIRQDSEASARRHDYHYSTGYIYMLVPIRKKSRVYD